MVINIQFIKHTATLLLIFGILFIGVFSSGCLQSGDSHEEMYAQEISAVEEFANDLHARQTAFLSDAFAAEKALAINPDNPDVIRTGLNRIYDSNPTITRVFYADETGYVADTIPFGSEIYIGKQIDNIDTSSNAQIVTAKLIPRIEEGNPPAPAQIIPVIADGSYKGSILAFLDMTGPISSIRAKYPEYEENWTFWIINTDGEFVNAPQARFIGMNINDIPESDSAGIIEAFARVINGEKGIEVVTAYSFTQLKLADYAIAWKTITVNDAGNEQLTIVLVSELSERDPYATPPVSTEKGLEEFVQSAYLYAHYNGKEAALSEFNKADGEFTTDKYYILAFNSTTILAHPYLPQNVNTTSFYVDTNGVKISELLNRRADQGGGYVVATYPNPAANMQEQLALAYVLPVDNDDWYVTAGVYENKPVTIDVDLRNTLTQYLRSIVTFADGVSKDEALEVLNDPNGMYYPNDTIRFFAMDKTGTVLADPVVPKNIGMNYMQRTDMFGGSITRDAVLLAGSGGGYQYEYVPIEDAGGALELRYEYVLPVNDEWFVLASVKAE